MTPTNADLDLDQFFQHHFPVIRGKCARMLGDSEEAADVAQETFLRLVGSPVAREPASFMAGVRSSHRPAQGPRESSSRFSDLRALEDGLHLARWV